MKWCFFSCIDSVELHFVPVRKHAILCALAAARSITIQRRFAAL